MTRNEHLLDILIEECAEVIQRATKAKRFGLLEVQPEQDLTNRERIINELNDLVAVAELLMGLNLINKKKVIAKYKKVEYFLEYSRECGTLEEQS